MSEQMVLMQGRGRVFRPYGEPVIKRVRHKEWRGMRDFSSMNLPEGPSRFPKYLREFYIRNKWEIPTNIVEE